MIWLLLFLPVVFYMTWMIVDIYFEKLRRGDFERADFEREREHRRREEEPKKKEIKRVISKEDPYGEENWEK